MSNAVSSQASFHQVFADSALFVLAPHQIEQVHALYATLQQITEPVACIHVSGRLQQLLRAVETAERTGRTNYAYP